MLYFPLNFILDKFYDTLQSPILDELVKNSVYDILISTLKGESVLNAYAIRGILNLKMLVDIVIWPEIQKEDPVYFRLYEIIS